MTTTALYNHLIAVGEAIISGAIVTTADGWWVRPRDVDRVARLLPVDPCSAWEADTDLLCGQLDLRGRRCARPRGHRRRHAAIDRMRDGTARIVSVWGQR